MNATATKLELALDLFEVGVELFRRKLERTQADLSGDEVTQRVQDWLHTQPEIEAGEALSQLIAWRR